MHRKQSRDKKKPAKKSACKERSGVMTEQILKIGREFSAELKKNGLTLPDHAEFLYEEKGLPK